MVNEEDKSDAMDPYAAPTAAHDAASTAARRAMYVEPADAPAAPPVPTGAGAQAPANIDPYSNPTGFVSFGQTYGANAATAKRGAAHLQQGVDDAAAKARKTLGEDESGLTKTLGTINDAAPTESWAGPDAYAPNGNTYEQYGQAQQKAANLGSNAGVQESLGPGTSMFAAALTRHAGGAGFQATQDKYAGLGGETEAAAARGATAIGGAKKSQADRYATATAQKAARDAAVARWKASLSGVMADGRQQQLGGNGLSDSGPPSTGFGAPRYYSAGYQPTDEDLHAFGYGQGFDDGRNPNGTERDPIRVTDENRGY